MKKAKTQAERALKNAMRSGVAGAQSAVAALRNAASSIVNGGLREIEAAAQATQNALQRFLAASERATRKCASKVARRPAAPPGLRGVTRTRPGGQPKRSDEDVLLRQFN